MSELLRLLLVMALIIAALLFSGVALDTLLGDTGKMLYGALCWVTGYHIVPWATDSNRKWMGKYNVRVKP